MQAKQQKTVCIVHGWGGSPNSDWLPWLKKELENRNFQVIVPEMPETENPKISAWVSHLSKIVEKPDENTFFVGHSIGCQTIMRYLETLKNKKVGGIVFVAGWLKLINLENSEITIAEPWLKKTIDFSKIKNLVKNKIIVFLSDNDPYNCVEENKKMFQDKLSADVIVLKNKGHFTAENGFGSFPELLGTILKQNAG